MEETPGPSHQKSSGCCSSRWQPAIGLLGQRDFALLWAGQTTSGVGNWLLTVAAPLYVYARTGSTLATSLAFMSATLPGLLLGPVAGSLTDRWPPRYTMLAADLALASVIAVLLSRPSEQCIWVLPEAIPAPPGPAGSLRSLPPAGGLESWLIWDLGRYVLLARAITTRVNTCHYMHTCSPHIDSLLTPAGTKLPIRSRSRRLR